MGVLVGNEKRSNLLDNDEVELSSRNQLAHVLQATDTSLPVILNSERGAFPDSDYCATSVRTGSTFLHSPLSRNGS